MQESMINGLADLAVVLDHAGVKELVVDGDTHRYRPQSAMTPDLAALLKKYGSWTI
ncbi:MAG: hypothetical protein HQ567_07200 [Candidatus Nealsonbacteria bacterium]|nr:hypothetical protein [Candidatus Nealsonbacteria bacterium]